MSRLNVPAAARAINSCHYFEELSVEYDSTAFDLEQP